MRYLILISVMLAAPAMADTAKPAADGTLIGPDGTVWRVEGCAAHPVVQSDERKSQTRRQARLKMTRPSPAQSTPEKQD